METSARGSEQRLSSAAARNLNHRRKKALKGTYDLLSLCDSYNTGAIGRGEEGGGRFRRLGTAAAVKQELEFPPRGWGREGAALDPPSHHPALPKGRQPPRQLRPFPRAVLLPPSQRCSHKQLHKGGHGHSKAQPPLGFGREEPSPCPWGS